MFLLNPCWIPDLWREYNKAVSKDWRHCFLIVKNSGQTEILANIDNTGNSEIHDMILAFHLNAIKEIESQLRFYKKFLLSQPDVKE